MGDILEKVSASLGQTMAVGTGGGVAAGTLAALLEENPSLKSVLKSALVGGASGAVVGGGVHALTGGSSPAPPAPEEGSDTMNLPLAAVTGLVPGIGPAIHGALSQGKEQALTSGLASVAGPAAAVPVTMRLLNKQSPHAGKMGTISALLSMLGATGAAAYGNHQREKSAKLVDIWGKIEPVTSQVKKSEPVRTGPKFMAHTVGGKELGMMTLSEFLHLPLPGKPELHKEAARMVRKTVMREEHHDHCPHCDYEFVEKSWPKKVGLPEDDAERRQAIEDGDYDEQCPSCGGIIDQDEMTDAEIEEHCSQGWFSDDKEFAEQMRQKYRKQRDNQRRRREEREKSASEMETFIGFDFDGTLAKKIDPYDPDKCGDPIPKMIKKLRKHLDDGDECKIFTARASGDKKAAKKVIHAFLEENDLPKLDVIGDKLPGMIKFYDDRAVSVKEDEGTTKEARISGRINGNFTNSRINIWAGNDLRPKKDQREKEANLRQARAATDTNPTPAMAEAGNYKKGGFSFKGIEIKLENPKGTERVGYDKEGNEEWRSLMHADYGYFKSTKAVDGDEVDVFVGPDLESDFVVAIDQYKDAGNKNFDETKFVVGVTTQEQGEKLYLQHYPRDWRLGPVSTTTVPQLKKWLKEGKTKKPFKGQMIKAAKPVALSIWAG